MCFSLVCVTRYIRREMEHYVTYFVKSAHAGVRAHCEIGTGYFFGDRWYGTIRRVVCSSCSAMCRVLHRIGVQRLSHTSVDTRRRHVSTSDNRIERHDGVRHWTESWTLCTTVEENIPVRASLNYPMSHRGRLVSTSDKVTFARRLKIAGKR